MEHVERLAADGQALAFALLREVARRHPGDNLILSPYGITSALAQLYAGARGQTARAMAKGLSLSLPQPQLHAAFHATRRALAARSVSDPGLALLSDGAPPPSRLDVHNAVWLREGLEPEQAYLDTLSMQHDASVFLASFLHEPEQVRVAINDWVAERTEQRVPALFPPGALTASTQMVLTNTVYFSASWESPFDTANTKDAPFTRLDGTRVKVPMMNDLFPHLLYARGPRYEAIALPYASKDLVFLAVLPERGAYAQVEGRLDARELARLRDRLLYTHVNLTMPRLDLRSGVQLAPALGALGMKPAFAPSADFSGIADVKPLYVSDIVHEAVVQVSEDGTVAAAATGSFLVGEAEDPPKERIVRLDRPYLFAILDEPTGQLLFLGRVLDPSK